MPSYDYVHYSEISSIELDEKTIIVNNSYKLVYQSSKAAEYYCSHIRSMVTTNAEGRMVRFEAEIGRATDIALIDAEVKSSNKGMHLLRYSGAFLFSLIFAVFPLWILLNGIFQLNLLPFLLMLLATYLLCVVFYFISSKRLHSRVDFTDAVQLMFCPVGISHTVSLLTASSLSCYDSTAIALFLLKRDRLTRFLRRRYNELLISCANDYPADLLHRFSLLRDCYSDIFKQLDISETDLLSYEPLDPNSKAYCPVCHGEYIENVGKCSDCGVVLTSILRGNQESGVAGEV